MIARARRDADEREVVLDRDGGHQGLRTVASGHAEAVCPPSDGVVGELGEVDTAVQEHSLDTEVLGHLREPELLHLAATGPGVAEQDGLARTNVHGDLATVQLVQVRHQGDPCTRRRDGHQRDQQQKP